MDLRSYKTFTKYQETATHKTEVKRTLRLVRMPRNAVCQPDISVTTTSPFSPRQDHSLTEVTLKQEVSGEEKSTQAEGKTVDKSVTKLPVIRRPGRHDKGGKNNLLQGLLHGEQCFDFALEGLMPELNKLRKNSTPPNHSQGVTKLVGNQDIRHERETFVCIQDIEENNLLPLSSSILEGQRLNIRKKELILTSNRVNMQHCRKPSDKGNKLPYQTYSTPKHSEFAIISSKLSETKTPVCNVDPLRPSKQEAARPVFHLPTADKYDITPRNINSKAGRVFRPSRKSPLFKSGYSNGQLIPRRDSYFIRNSVFKTILQQPGVLLRQPSPVSGVKMTLKEHDEFSVEAIQTVEKTNIQLPCVEDKTVAEVVRPVKKFVIRLPPIC